MVAEGWCQVTASTAARCAAVLDRVVGGEGAWRVGVQDAAARSGPGASSAGPASDCVTDRVSPPWTEGPRSTARAVRGTTSNITQHPVAQVGYPMPLHHGWRVQADRRLDSRQERGTGTEHHGHQVHRDHVDQPKV